MRYASFFSGVEMASLAFKPLGWDLVSVAEIDPFMGAGTTALVADRLQRHAIGFELGDDHVQQAEDRIADDRGGGLLDLMEE